MSCRQREKVNKKREKVANTRLYCNERTKYKIVGNKIQRHWQLSLICTTMPHWQLSCVTKVDNRKKLTLVIPDQCYLLFVHPQQGTNCPARFEKVVEKDNYVLKFYTGDEGNQEVSCAYLREREQRDRVSMLPLMCKRTTFAYVTTLVCKRKTCS